MGWSAVYLLDCISELSVTFTPRASLFALVSNLSSCVHLSLQGCWEEALYLRRDEGACYQKFRGGNPADLIRGVDSTLGDLGRWRKGVGRARSILRLRVSKPPRTSLYS